MPTTDHRALMNVIDKLYGAAVEPSLWPDFLSGTAAMFAARNAFICQIDGHQPRDYLGLPQNGRERLPIASYETLIGEDPRMPVFRASLGRPVHCRMATTPQRLHGSRAYRDYLQPLDIEYAMVAALPVRQGLTHDFGLTRDRAGVAFNEDDRELLGVLTPHLARSFAIRRALQEKAGPAPARPAAIAPTQALASLQRGFGLSPSQARLALALHEGHTLKRAAAALGLTEGTARQYLHAIAQKTGASRQLDLVRLIDATLARAG